MITDPDAESLEKIESARSFEVLAQLAYDMIVALPNPAGMVCGPLTTGGGSLEKNTANIIRAGEILSQKGLSIFNQNVFGPAFVAMSRNRPIEERSNYFQEILEHFYLPLFKSRAIRTLFFLPGWQRSTGAAWEFKTARDLNLVTLIMDNDWDKGCRNLVIPPWMFEPTAKIFLDLYQQS